MEGTVLNLCCTHFVDRLTDPMSSTRPHQSPLGLISLTFVSRLTTSRTERDQNPLKDKVKVWTPYSHQFIQNMVLDEVDGTKEEFNLSLGS